MRRKHCICGWVLWVLCWTFSIASLRNFMKLWLSILTKNYRCFHKSCSRRLLTKIQKSSICKLIFSAWNTSLKFMFVWFYCSWSFCWKRFWFIFVCFIIKAVTHVYFFFYWFLIVSFIIYLTGISYIAPHCTILKIKVCFRIASCTPLLTWRIIPRIWPIILINCIKFTLSCCTKIIVVYWAVRIYSRIKFHYATWVLSL